MTEERAIRLHRLLQLLGAGPQTRAALSRRLGLDVRGFYRDLELLRAADIRLRFVDRRYVLEEPLAAAVARLPFPDPHLNLGEAVLLARGRSEVHRKLKRLLDHILHEEKGRKQRRR